MKTPPTQALADHIIEKVRAALADLPKHTVVSRCEYQNYPHIKHNTFRVELGLGPNLKMSLYIEELASDYSESPFTPSFGAPEDAL